MAEGVTPRQLTREWCVHCSSLAGGGLFCFFLTFLDPAPQVIQWAAPSSSMLFHCSCTTQEGCTSLGNLMVSLASQSQRAIGDHCHTAVQQDSCSYFAVFAARTCLVLQDMCVCEGRRWKNKASSSALKTSHLLYKVIFAVCKSIRSSIFEVSVKAASPTIFLIRMLCHSLKSCS